MGAETITDAVEKGIEWLEENQEADPEEYKEQKKSVEEIVSPIISGIYQGGEGGGALVLGGDTEHTVDVNLEGDLDLRHATRGRRDVLEVELAEQVVVLGHRALAFEPH